MANEFISVKEIARQTLPRLIENLVFPNLIHKDFSNDFQPGKGTQIQVRKPVVLKATDFDSSTGTSPQSIVDTSVTVTLDHIASVDVEASAVDMAMSIDDLTRVFIEPAAVALAEKINRDGLDLYKDIPYCVGTPGATADSLEKLADVSKGLNDRKVPTENRVALWDTAADAKLKTIPAIVNAEKSGTTAALRNGAIGDVFGLHNYMSQAIKHHTSGTLKPASNGKIAVKTAVTDASSVTLSSATLTGTLVKGDILVIGGNNYVVKANAAADSNEITVSVYPKLTAKASEEVTLLADHTANLAFNPMAFAFVTRPLTVPAGVESYVTSYNGITLRVTRGYDMKYKKDMFSMDVLYGYATMYEELAERVLG